MNLELRFSEQSQGSRHCGGCTLCCKLLPTAEINKPANSRCQHQRHGKGCAIYQRRPISCQLWSCGWLVDKEAAGLSRPDRSHYVLDIMPDFVTMQYEDGTSINIPIVQVWIDPLYPDAHRDPALRAYLDKIGRAALIRDGDIEGFLLVPPSVAADQEWHEERSRVQAGRQHSADEILAVTGTSLRFDLVGGDG